MVDVRDILHVGQISSVNPETATAKVAFDDLDGYVSPDMQIIFPAMGRWKAFWTPSVGDHVAALRLPNGIQEGFVLGTQYTASNLPNEGTGGLITIVSEDGQSRIWLDADAGTLTLRLGREITINAPDIKLAGNVQVDGNLSVTGDITNNGNMQTNGIHIDSNGRHGI